MALEGLWAGFEPRQTRLNFSDWAEQYRARNSLRLDSLLTQSARREGMRSNTTVMRSFVEGAKASEAHI